MRRAATTRGPLPTGRWTSGSAGQAGSCPGRSRVGANGCSQVARTHLGICKFEIVSGSTPLMPRTSSGGVEPPSSVEPPPAEASTPHASAHAEDVEDSQYFRQRRDRNRRRGVSPGPADHEDGPQVQHWEGGGRGAEGRFREGSTGRRGNGEGRGRYSLAPRCEQRWEAT